MLIPAVAVAVAVAGCTSTTTTASSAGNVTAAGSAATCTVTTVAHDVLPSVVTISASGAAGAGTGSGEVIKSDGYILTNNHVISPAANGGKVEVTFASGTTVPATIVGRDILTDLAVLKVKPPFDLKAIAMGSSDSVQVGQPVVVLGAPLGLSGTVTSGNRERAGPDGGSARGERQLRASRVRGADGRRDQPGQQRRCPGELLGRAHRHSDRGPRPYQARPVSRRAGASGLASRSRLTWARPSRTRSSPPAG